MLLQLVRFTLVPSLTLASQELAQLLWHKNFTIANKPAAVGLDRIIQDPATTMLRQSVNLFHLPRLDPSQSSTNLVMGFVGGQWTYCLNANQPEGVALSDGNPLLLNQDNRRLALYFLGWESIELHQDACLTPLFAEEIDKLQPWFYNGSGAWYNSFRRYDRQ
uniref:D-aminoacyl-tRNA deacylase n=1 Tax=Talaromyces marneffei PM1 TaxID=1077442 RepID=A0A093UZZ3_TALMA